jgi:CRISPR-associated protein Csh1
LELYAGLKSKEIEMIEALYQIGMAQEKSDFLEEYIDELDPKKYKQVFKIIFNIDDINNIEYKGIEREDFDPGKKMKYCYKEVKGNNCSYFPTAPITTIEKTLRKIANSINKFLLDFTQRLSDDDKKILKSLFSEKIQESIIQDFSKNNDSQTKGCFLTVAFEKAACSLYVGDTPFFRKAFDQNDASSTFKDFYNKYNIESRAQNKICYICRKKADEVWGFVNTYNFYTVDKESFVSGGFKQENAWRNYPVCPECAQILNRGKKYVEKNLTYKFCGLTYFLIPELIIYDENTLKQLLKTMTKYQNFSVETADSTEKVEERILRDLAECSNYVNFNFLFYEKTNSAFRILLNLQEIAPSRLKFLIDKKDETDNFPYKFRIFDVLKEEKGKIKEIETMRFSFQFIREFFSMDFTKDFLEIMNHIFCNNKISATLLFSRFMSKITTDFTNNKYFGIQTLKAYKILQYINAVEQLDKRSRKMSKIPSKFEDFFKENPMIDSCEKRALFLEGVLAQKLLNIQFRERNASPFRSRLNGLKIDEKIARKIFPEIINKLEEYGKNYYKGIEEEISLNFLKSDFSSYTIAEMSFYFTLGMTLAKHITTKEEQEDNLTEETSKQEEI